MLFDAHKTHDVLPIVKALKQSMKIGDTSLGVSATIAFETSSQYDISPTDTGDDRTHNTALGAELLAKVDKRLKATIQPLSTITATRADRKTMDCEPPEIELR